ncbi:SulP family inorganic anion transporter [Desulfobotulus sp. H1]|uniref:SulP family inorganic anion transporter n=1 Tax=Desulfobotulus pelophilus TaxID=2823377 RepID=A0ABT3N993_9BACT|nr:SulP family inorganic anion transporter [Desulfobotulus pelophilus]MCW7754005.1 SulP family inorganic anion transporter [Desulfobotulus pelophilus]
MNRSFSITALRGDLFGGLTAGIVALPLALAFGVASGAGAAAGLYGAIMLGMMAALFGGTRTQISGPTGPMTVVFASMLLAVGGDLAIAMSAVLIAGLVQIIMGCIKVGGLVRFIPYPVISGFMSGIGIIIILLQIAPFLGAGPKTCPFTAILAMPAIIMAVNFQALVLGGLTLLIVFLTPMRISRIIPSPLVALIAVTLLSLGMGFQVPVIGEIPLGLPAFIMPTFCLNTWTTILVLGVTLALLGSIDSLLTALVADSVTGTRHNSNRELVGQGIGNMLCSFVGGLPGAGATMRTVVNIKAGGKTRISGVTHALFLLVLLLGAAPLATHIPMAVLAGILIKVGVDILDYRLLRLVKTAPRTDLTVMGVVFVLTVFVDLIIAVGAGVILSMGMIIHRMVLQANFRLYSTDHDRSDAMEGRVRILEISGPFFFGSMSRLVDEVDGVLDTKAVVFDCRKVPFIDLSAIFALEEILLRLKDSKIRTFVVLTKELRDQLVDLHDRDLPEEILFEDFEVAMEEARIIAQ